MARDIEVINRHLAIDAEKKQTSNRYDNRYDNRGMQDNSHNSSKNVGLSKSQSSRGPPDAKKTRAGESRPGPAGTPQNNYSHLQGPQWPHYKGNQGPQFHSKS